MNFQGSMYKNALVGETVAEIFENIGKYISLCYQ